MVRSQGSRLVRAVLVAVAAFLLVGGGAGFVMAASGAQGPLSVPVPRPGDRATYSVQAEAIGDVGSERPILPADVVYEWLPESTVLDDAFVARPSQPLQWTLVFRAGGNESRYTKLADHDPWTGEPFHTTAHGSQMMQPVLLGNLDGSLGHGVDTVLEPAVRVDFASDYYGWLMGPPCAQRAPLHGAAPDALPRELRLGTCGWSDERAPLFVAGGWDELPSGRAFRFDAPSQPLLHVWYETGSPFPVRFTTALGDGLDPSLSDGRLFTLERTAWARGSDEYPQHAPHPGASRAVPLVPLLPGRLLDDDGLGGELPLSRAYAAAEAAPRSTARQGLGAFAMGTTQPSVAEWLAAHPNGYLADARRQESTDWYGQKNPYWRLLWVDGDAWLGKMVSWEPTQEDPFSAHLPDATGRRVVVMDYYPTPAEQMPALLDSYPAAPGHSTLPLARDVAARYLETADDPSAAITNYGFRFVCHDGCARAVAYVYAGEMVTTVDSKASVAGGSSTFVSLAVDETGHALQRYTQVTEQQPVLGLGPPTPEDAPRTRAAAPTGAWDLPRSPAAATGLSLLAAFAGALYYFWPALKGAALGLFSRTRDDDLLEHPRRAQVVQLVQAQPGIHFQDLARTIGMGRGNLEHHLRKLVAAGILTKVLDKGYACYFPKGAVDRRVMAAAPLLRAPGSRAVFEALRTHPGLSGREVARRVGLSQSTVSYHLRRLQEAGLVFSAGAGVQLSPLGEQAATAAA